VLRGENHFWKFAQWVDFEQEFDARPAFYFMARKGSLAEYALGTPDAFYDIRSQRFRKLFRYLDGEGCEIGLHASFHAYRGVEWLQREKQLLEEQAEVVVAGNRHHYWHLNPDAPNDTLALHEQAGLEYDSSLGFEFYPGFRRGVCHPFRPYHPGLRRELGLVELPPAWMDDHFHRRLRRNGIESPEDHAQQLLNIARATHGAIIVDYHARGMNADFFPQYGAWLMNFMRKHVNAEVAFATPAEIADVYKKHEAVLEAASRDTTGPKVVAPGSPVRVTEFRKEDSAACEAFVEAHPGGNIYHSPAWTAVTQEGLGHCPFYLKATDGAGRITGVLPLFLVKGITGRRLVSVPMRDRGGLLALDRVSGRALLAQAVDLSHGLRCAYLELRSLDEFDAELASEFGLLVTRHWITTRVDLSPGVERLWKALDKNAIRWAINKASRTGMTFEDDESEAGIDLFYDLFVRTRTHMGIPPFPKSLFTAIWRHLIAEGKGKLFVVRKQGVPVNAMINLLSGNTFVPAYAAPQNEWRKSYPSEFMIWHSIRWAAERGFTSYDFGADSPHQTGLLQFKKKWGGVQYPVSYVYHLNGRSKPPNFDSSSGAYAAVRRIWRRFPLPLSRGLGAWATRQLS
jgi:FemAB-related protein (PEP-CTERM system-associated)